MVVDYECATAFAGRMFSVGGGGQLELPAAVGKTVPLNWFYLAPVELSPAISG